LGHKYKEFIMKKTTIAVTLAGVMIALASAGVQARDHHRGHGGPKFNHPHAHHHKGKHAHKHAHKGPRHAHRGRGPVVSYGGPPPHRWARGQHLPSHYRHGHYRVVDWRHYHLGAPAPGHYWVNVGSDFLLVAAATGVIASIILR